MDTNTYFQSGGISITKDVARFDGTSYAIRNINTVKIEPKSPSINLGAAAIAIGVLLIVLEFYTVGLLLAAMGVVFIIVAVQRKRFELILVTSSGNVQALESSNQQLVSDVKLAIERAFASTGSGS